MANLISPEISVVFYEKGATAITRGERGTVALALKDSAQTGGPVFDILTAADIPSGLTTANKGFVLDALKGYQTAPKKVIVYVMTTGDNVTLSDAYDAMMAYFETHHFDWMAIPTVATDEMTSTIATWIKGLRSNADMTCKAVLPNSASDSEAIVNVTSSLYDAAGTAVSAEKTTPRIAGLLAGTPLTISATYAPLLDYADCTRLTKAEADAAVTAGKFVYKFDGEKVKVCRAVNSFTTTTADKGDSFKKIKVVEIMDLIHDDVKSTIEDGYVGKYANSYDNKCLLVTAINAYFAELVRSGLLASGTAEINLPAQKNYLESKGIDTSEMTDQEIKEANTDTHVFLLANISILDAMEDVSLEIYI